LGAPGDDDGPLLHGGQVSFVVSSGTGAGKLIDAVQLTMARGEIKIPVIEFTVGTVNLASDIKLDFLASLFDGDGDAATSAFSAHLNANTLDGSLFDYGLEGTALPRDTFNVDLSAVEDQYLVTGWNAGDALVFLGAGGTPLINNSGNDSIVTVTEADSGQVTTVTVVGVDLAPGDIFFQPTPALIP
jgi:hypothetical protein